MAARPVEVGVNDFSSPLVEKFRTEHDNGTDAADH